MYGYGFNPYTSGPSYSYSPYINPYEAALAQERARRVAAEREAYARALAQQERERRARAAAARRNPYGFGGFYDPEEEEEYDYDMPALKRQRELDDAARLRAMYNRAARRGDEMDVDSTSTSKAAPAPARQRKSPSPQRTSIPINVHSTKPPSPKPASPQPTPPPAPQPQPSIQIEPTQAAHTAASSIQRTWRRHHALRQLQSLRSKFDDLANKFEAPGVLEYTLKNAKESEDGLEEVAEVETAGLPYEGFVRPVMPVEEEGDEAKEEGDAEMKEEGWEEVKQSDEEAKENARADDEVPPQPTDSTTASTIQPQPQLDTTVVPSLSYTSSTRAIHAQNEALLRLLNALDAVPSWGDSAVREARKHLAKDVEGEAARLDAWWKAVWREKGASARVKRVRA